MMARVVRGDKVAGQQRPLVRGDKVAGQQRPLHTKT